LVPFESLGAVFCLPSILTMTVSVTVCEIFSVKEWCDLENILGFVQGHWKWHHLIDRIRVPIRLPRRNFVKMFDAGKTRMIGLLYGEQEVKVI